MPGMSYYTYQVRTKHCLSVIPDVHMRGRLLDEAQRLHAEGFKVVFLGDYADNGPKPNDPLFLREVFEFCRKANAVPLIGNHDLAYIFPDQPKYQVFGYEAANARRMADVYAEAADILQYVYRLDRYVCSHAGISRALLNVLAIKYDVHGLNEVIQFLNEQKPEELYYCSHYNGGTDAFDGPMWLRLPQFHGALSELGIMQVVGHSSQSAIRLKHNLLMIDVKRPLVIEWQEDH